MTRIEKQVVIDALHFYSASLERKGKEDAARNAPRDVTAMRDGIIAAGLAIDFEQILNEPCNSVKI